MHTSSTMTVTLLVLACLAVASNGRRVQTSWQPAQGFVGTPGHAAAKPRSDVKMQRGFDYQETGPGAVDYTKKEMYMYNEPYAPPGQGREYINAPNVRKPIEQFVGASEELQIGRYLKGEPLIPWDPMNFHKLSKVSANNPDVSFMRDAELKHGRIAMLAFVGICTTAAGKHWPAPAFADACAAGWPSSLGKILSTNPGIFWQALLTIALVEGVSSTNRGEGKEVNWWDGLWFGERENGIVAGDLGFDPLGLKPKDPKAYEQMQLKELKNGRLAMLAVMDIFFRYVGSGKAFPEIG